MMLNVTPYVVPILPTDQSYVGQARILMYSIIHHFHVFVLASIKGLTHRCYSWNNETYILILT
jgi:hypothetical protein